jgi:putative hydrolase of the HAD superfamily
MVPPELPIEARPIEARLSGETRVRAVLLDGLGTLVALDPPWPAFAEQLQREHGILLTPAEAEWAFASEMAYYRAHHPEGRDSDTLAALRRRCAEVLHAALPPFAALRLSPAELHSAMLAALRFRAHPDALATLPLLRARGITLVVVSNWDISLPAVLDDLGLRELLDGVLTSAQFGLRKPAPELFRAALEIAGVVPEEALHVGDELREDILGARAVGISAVLLRRVPRPAGRLAAPAGVPTIASLAQLPWLL